MHGEMGYFAFIFLVTQTGLRRGWAQGGRAPTCLWWGLLLFLSRGELLSDGPDEHISRFVVRDKRTQGPKQKSDGYIVRSKNVDLLPGSQK